MPLVTRTGVEIARTGRWNASTGEWNCTRSQLADAVRAHQSGKFRAPVLKRGHVDPRYAGDAHVNADGEPALGQVRNLRLANGGDSLIGDLLVPDWLDEELPAIYPSRSVEADLGVETSDGDHFDMVVSGLALLGVTAPAIQSLADLPERVAASEFVAALSVAASIPVAAGFWDEAAHPRGGKGSAAGGKFVAKGSGYQSAGKAGDASTVKAVQKELIRLGLLAPDSGKSGGVDGLFGPKTDAAVKKWQTGHGHTATGKVSEQLLATLKAAKKGDHGQAQKTADAHPKKRRQAKVKAAAEALAAAHGYGLREITADTIVLHDDAGLVWVARWDDTDDTVTVGDPAPATVTYTPLAASSAASAVHTMHRPLLFSQRGWDARTITASLGDTTLDITPLREALGLDDTADETAVMKAATERLQANPTTETPTTTTEPAAVTPASTPAAPEGHVTSTDTVRDVEALVAAKVAAALAGHTAGQDALRAELTRVSSELAGRKQAETVTRRETLLASAVQSGRIRPADKDRYAALFDAAPEATTGLLDALAPGTAVPVQASGYAGTEAGGSDDNALYDSWFGGSTNA